MNSLSSKFQTKFTTCIRRQCKSTSTQSDDCQLKLDNLPNETTILDVDCMTGEDGVQFTGKRCDFLIVVSELEPNNLVPVEFKSSYYKTEEVKQQLEGGIKLFNKFHNGDFSIYPVLVSKTLKGNNFRKKLQQTVICYRDKRARIKHVLCNQQLDWNQI